MKTNKTTTIVLILIAVIVLILIFISTKEVEFNKVDLPVGNKNYVSNRTNQSYLDTILQLGLKELELRNVAIILEDMEESPQIEGQDIRAYVVGRNGQYIIFTKKHSRTLSIEIMSHELIHVAQIESGILYKGETFITWDGLTVLDPNMIPYFDRPWEKDAYLYGEKLGDRIKKTLIKK